MSKGFIFDVDGTLLDSMSIWMDASNLYLKNNGCVLRENVAERMLEMTMKEGAEYIQKNYLPDKTLEEICQGVNAQVYNYYEKEAMPKQGIIAFLDYALEKGIPMAVATSTDRPMIDVAFNRLGFHKYFKEIFTTTEVGCGKDNPKIFELVAKSLGTEIRDTWMFEDALYSIRTAKAVGMNVLGIYDFSSDKDSDEIKRMSDIYIKDWTNYKDVIKKIDF